MNRVLANVLSYSNAFLAVCLVAIGILLGVAEAGETVNPAWALIGGCIGLVAAVLFCGLIAIFIDIRDTLAEIRDAVQGERPARADPPLRPEPRPPSIGRPEDAPLRPDQKPVTTTPGPRTEPTL